MQLPFAYGLPFLIALGTLAGAAGALAVASSGDRSRAHRGCRFDDGVSFDRALALGHLGLAAQARWRATGDLGAAVEAARLLFLALDQTNAVLDKHRDSDGVLPPQLSHEEELLSLWATALVDLEKAGVPLGPGP
ncbi:MAG: hypothetical protein AB7N76_33245 [Planctomycetota bacterium]